MTPNRVGGIHHVTAIAADPQENLDFYAGTLGMRLVKRSVNQDDPGTYHLFYADAEGRPGSDLTFFPWPEGDPGRQGAGLVNEVVLAVPPGSLDWWHDRLEARGVTVGETEERFGEPTLRFQDPHGLPLALTATELARERPFSAFPRSSVPDDHQVRGLHAVRVVEGDRGPTVDLATAALGLTPAGSDGPWFRFAGRDRASGFLEVRSDADARRGISGVGTVHHVAWRAADDRAHEALRDTVRQAGVRTTDVIDRFWFKSVYFREPGGVLLELATDGPGFGVDEPMERLGERLVLPPWLEDSRDDLEAALPNLELPYGVAPAEEATAPTG